MQKVNVTLYWFHHNVPGAFLSCAIHWATIMSCTELQIKIYMSPSSLAVALNLYAGSAPILGLHPFVCHFRGEEACAIWYPRLIIRSHSDTVSSFLFILLLSFSGVQVSLFMLLHLCQMWKLPMLIWTLGLTKTCYLYLAYVSYQLEITHFFFFILVLFTRILLELPFFVSCKV